MQRFDDPAGSIGVEVGETFALALAGNPTTGYTWQLEMDPHYLELLDQAFEPTGAGVGTGGHEVFQIRALATGECEIRGEYRRAWETGAREARRIRVAIG